MHLTRSVRLLAVGLAATLTLTAACGDSGDDGDDVAAEERDTSSTPTDSADSTDDSGDSGDGATDGAVDVGAFPVTIEHAFGATEIEAEPTRVLTWGWGSADAALALGVVPVAIPFQNYGGDEQGVLPWIHEALAEMGAEVPTVLPDVEEPPFEAIAAAQPDLILAAYSGISAEDYELLSAIAPTVAYPGEAWSTPWRELIDIVGTSLGRSEAATALLAEIDTAIADQATAHPELAGKTFASVWDTGDTFYVYKAADARVEFNFGLGMVSAPSVDELSTDESTFYFTLSHEELGRLTSDLLISYADTPEASAAFLASPGARLMDQVANGAVAEVVGPEFIAAVSPPTALSLTWGLDEYIALLADAAAAT